MSGMAQLFGVVVAGRPLLCDWSPISPEKYVAMLTEPRVVPELTFFLMPGTGALHVCVSSQCSRAYSTRIHALTDLMSSIPSSHLPQRSHSPWLWGHSILYSSTGRGMGSAGQRYDGEGSDVDKVVTH